MASTTGGKGIGSKDTKTVAVGKKASFMPYNAPTETNSGPVSNADHMDEPIVGDVAALTPASQNPKMVTADPETAELDNGQQTAWMDVSMGSQTSVEPSKLAKTQQHTTSVQQENPPPVVPLPPRAPPAVGAVASDGPLPSKGLRNNSSTQAKSIARAGLESPQHGMPTQPKVGAVKSTGPLPKKGLRGNNILTQEESFVPLTRAISSSATGPQVGPQISKVAEAAAGRETLVESVPGATAIGVPRRQLGDLKAKGMGSPTRPTASAASGPQDETHIIELDETADGQEQLVESVPGASAVDVPRRQFGDLKKKGLRNNNTPSQVQSHGMAGVPSLPPMPTPASMGAVTSTGELPKKGLRGNTHSSQDQNVVHTAKMSTSASELGEAIRAEGNRPGGSTNASSSAQAPAALDNYLGYSNNPLLHQIELNSTPERLGGSREAEMSRQRSIVEATLVTEDMDHERTNNLPMAEAVDSEREEKKVLERRKNRFPCWAKSVVVCVVLGIIVVVLVAATSLPSGGNEMKQQESVGSSSNEVVNTQEVYVKSILPEFTLRELDFEDAIHPSPQTLAFNWLMEDPNLEKYEDWRILQRYAMGTLYYSMGGPKWIENTHWLNHSYHENDWYHKVIIEQFEFSGLDELYKYIKRGNYDEVTHIWLFNNGLDGTIPPELSLISSLVMADFSTNRLRGSLPPELGTMSNLTALLVPWNDITGKIPVEYGQWPQMLWFNGRTNHLTGTIPTELGMGRFWVLDLKKNDLKGTIPSELGQLNEMVWLFLDDCQLSGTLPSELGLMTSLQKLRASGNQFSGPIPSELGNLVMANKDFTDYIDEVQHILVPDLDMRIFHDQLENAFRSNNANTIHLNSNRLTGTIPTDLARLNFLNLTQSCDSWLDGDEILCSALEFQDNFLTGTIPPLAPSLNYLDVSRNNFTGTISEDHCQQAKFTCSEWLCGCACECL